MSITTIIPITQVGAIPDRKNRGNVLVFKFRCDISYDGSPDGNVKGKRHNPRTYVFAGWFSSSRTWAVVERSWIAINNRYRVPRFHAAHLNSKTYEYEGWSDPKKIEYSKHAAFLQTNIEGLSATRDEEKWVLLIWLVSNLALPESLE